MFIPSFSSRYVSTQNLTDNQGLPRFHNMSPYQKKIAQVFAQKDYYSFVVDISNRNFLLISQDYKVFFQILILILEHTFFSAKILQL